MSVNFAVTATTVQQQSVETVLLHFKEVRYLVKSRKQHEILLLQYENDLPKILFTLWNTRDTRAVRITTSVWTVHNHSY